MPAGAVGGFLGRKHRVVLRIFPKRWQLERWGGLRMSEDVRRMEDALQRDPQFFLFSCQDWRKPEEIDWIHYTTILCPLFECKTINQSARARPMDTHGWVPQQELQWTPPWFSCRLEQILLPEEATLFGDFGLSVHKRNDEEWFD